MRQVVALVLAATLAGCSRGAAGADVAGPDVARTIDTQLAPALRTVPDLSVGAAACPDHLDVSAGKTAYCTLRAGDATLRVAVTGGPPPGNYAINQADTIIDMRDVERREGARLLNDYGLHAVIRCGAPRIRVAVAGTKLRCALTGQRLPADHLDLKIVDSAGHVLAFTPRGVRSPLEPFAPYLNAHKAGRPAVVPGAVMARYVQQQMRGLTRTPNGRGLAIGAAACPAHVDLSGTRRAVCRQEVAGKQLRVETWIDEPDGLHIHSLDFALGTKTVATAAEEVFRNKLRAAGVASLVAVDCGPDRVVVATPEHGVRCVLTAGSTSRALTAYPDAEGHGLRFDIAPQPSAAPQ